jgi:hypothetical protein
MPIRLSLKKAVAAPILTILLNWMFLGLNLAACSELRLDKG